MLGENDTTKTLAGPVCGPGNGTTQARCWRVDRRKQRRVTPKPRLHI